MTTGKKFISNDSYYLNVSFNWKVTFLSAMKFSLKMIDSWSRLACIAIFKSFICFFCCSLASTKRRQWCHSDSDGGAVMASRTRHRSTCRTTSKLSPIFLIDRNIRGGGLLNGTHHLHCNTPSMIHVSSLWHERACSVRKPCA